MTRPNPPGSPVVLIVEDEPLVRMTNLDILHEAGFRVIDANDADEAFEVLRRRDDVRAVLTDVDMPAGAVFLPKPYDAPRLVEELRRVMEAVSNPSS
jgi:CheY-like chemotaxis protein